MGICYCTGEKIINCSLGESSFGECVFGMKIKNPPLGWFVLGCMECVD